MAPKVARSQSRTSTAKCPPELKRRIDDVRDEIKKTKSKLTRRKKAGAEREVEEAEAELAGLGRKKARLDDVFNKWMNGELNSEDV